IGIIKVIGSYRIHDGIDRLEFVAGPSALDYINRMETSLQNIAKAAGIDSDKLENGISQRLAELKAYSSTYNSMAEALSGYIAKDIISSAKDDKVIRNLNYDRKMLRSIATKASDADSKAVILLYNDAGEAVCIAGEKSGKSAARFIAENSKGLLHKVFKGGGSDRIAEGKLTSD
ncbi:alanyl-tRNA synthetase, partial [mine drainage metagenome]